MRWLAILTGLTLAACAPEPQPATPALWQVDGQMSSRGWLFGTIHALDRPARWRTAAVDKALAEARVLVLEIGPEDRGALGQTFASLARTPGQPPLSQRVEPHKRAKLMALLKEADLPESQFADVETWAAALSLARALEEDAHGEYGVDLALEKAWAGRPIIALEGAKAQLQLFDRLPEQDQRDLLSSVVVDSDEDDTLSEAWRKGNMEVLDRETSLGLLADPELRDALYVKRNRAWAATIAAMLAKGERPFVAVGAAHMAGNEALPLLLKQSGFTVTRIQ